VPAFLFPSDTQDTPTDTSALTHPDVPPVTTLTAAAAEDSGVDPAAAAALLAAADACPAAPPSATPLKAAIDAHAAWAAQATAALAASRAAAENLNDAALAAARPALHAVVELVAAAEKLSLATPGATALRAMFDGPQDALAGVKRALNKRGTNMKADACIAALAESAAAVRGALDEALGGGGDRRGQGGDKAKVAPKAEELGVGKRVGKGKKGEVEVEVEEEEGLNCLCQQVRTRAVCPAGCMRLSPS
jgi:hypothetical protein